MKIKNKKIGKNFPVFIIAEAGVNYNNDLKIALKMVDLAAKAGADAIKFQTFKAEKIQLKNSVKPKYQEKIRGKNYFQIIKNLEPSFDEQKKIFNYCKKRGIIFLSTPYDIDGADFLHQLGVPLFKISSSDFSNHIFLKYILKKSKPILLSCGMATQRDVDTTIKLIKKFHMQHKFVLMQTTSNYPTSNDEVNLRVIPEFMKKYGVLVGFSDHTKDYTASLGAVALGACVVEKHFTLNRKQAGPDHSSSLEPEELKEWIKKIRLLENSLGSKSKQITESEKKNLTMRKILIIKSSKKGQLITNELLDTKRGNKTGILPTEENVSKILGKKLVRSIRSPTQFSLQMI